MISCSAQVFCRPLALAFSVQVPLALLVPPPKKGSFGGVDSSQDDSRSFDGHVMSCVFSPRMSQVRWANTFGKYLSNLFHHYASPHTGPGDRSSSQSSCKKSPSWLPEQETQNVIVAMMLES